MLSADSVTIPWQAIIAAGVLIGGALMSWGAYMMKQLVEHAKWMAAANEKFDHALEIAEHNVVQIGHVLNEQERVRLELTRLNPRASR